jgi:uncharacterized protein YunC (DUF1805 family)
MVKSFPVLLFQSLKNFHYFFPLLEKTGKVRPFISASEGHGSTGMQKSDLKLSQKKAEGYVIPIGQVNLVFATTDKGMVGCGAIDVMALDRFSYPAARVKPSQGTSIGTLDDLLAGIIKDANESAGKLGIKVGMTGREALDLL